MKKQAKQGSSISKTKLVDDLSVLLLRGLSESLDKVTSMANSKPALTDDDLKEETKSPDRLNPILQSVWSKLPVEIKRQMELLVKEGLLHPSTFKRIVFATYEEIFPRETRSLSPSTQASMHAWHEHLSMIAQDRGCLELKRALAKGLALDMARRGTLDVEGDAWVMAVGHGVGSSFNRSQSLPGYSEALVSVQNAVSPKRKKPGADRGFKGFAGVNLASALVTYWLPLGLWAMEVEDALEALRLSTFPAIFARSDEKTQAEMTRISSKKCALQKSVPPRIMPKEKSWRSRFTSAVHDRNLYRSPSAMINLDYRGASMEGRSDPQQWQIKFLPGFNCGGRW